MAHYNMNDLSVYNLPCGKCNKILNLRGPIEPTDINPKTGNPPLSKNIGRYFWVCEKCSYFRFFDLKWPKYLQENNLQGSTNQQSSISDTEFQKEFDNIINCLSEVSFQMVDDNTKILLKGKLEDLINKLNSSIEIPASKCDKYLEVTSQFIELLK